MNNIINPDNDLMKRKRYICEGCHKRYNLNKLELIDQESKCKKCGGRLISPDFRMY